MMDQAFPPPPNPSTHARSPQTAHAAVYLVATVAAAVAGVLASFVITDVESSTRNPWQTGLVVVACIVLVTFLPYLIAVFWVPAGTALTIRLVAMMISILVLIAYGALIWFSAWIGALGVSDRSASSLLIPLFLLAPLCALVGINVLVATPLSKRMRWKIMLVWIGVLAVVGAIAAYARITWWYGVS
ncbi:hypothetical protein [Microbacterium sp. GXF0217]